MTKPNGKKATELKKKRVEEIKEKNVTLYIWVTATAITLLISVIWDWKALLVFILATLYIYIIAFLMTELGKRNICWTLIDEGQAKGVTIFGRAAKCLMAFTAHRLAGETKPKEHIHSDTWWNVIKLGKDEPRPEKSWWHAFSKNVLGLEMGGLKWIGIWPFYQVYRYNFRWTSLRGHMPTDKAEGEDYKYEEARSMVLDYILVRQETYLLDLKGIEDIEQLSIDIKLVWTIQIVNPFLALFRVRNWLETASDRLLTHIRHEFAGTTWNEFQKSADLKNTLQTILVDIKNKYGVETIGLEITDLTPPVEFKTAAEAIRAAQANVEVAKHKAQAAKHDAEAIGILAAAEAGRVTAVMNAAKNLGEEGVAMKIAEDLSKGGGQITVIGSAARTLVKDLLGKKEETK